MTFPVDLRLTQSRLLQSMTEGGVRAEEQIEDSTLIISIIYNTSLSKKIISATDTGTGGGEVAKMAPPAQCCILQSITSNTP